MLIYFEKKSLLIETASKFRRLENNILNVRFLSYLSSMKELKGDKNHGQVPTKTEMAVLQVLWKNGPSTVRFVHDILNSQKEAVQYTSTLKLMQLMAEKDMLERDESNMKHIYSPLLKEEKTKGFMLGRFLDSMYNGSVSDLVMALLDNEKTSKKELQVLKETAKKLSDQNKK
jgi:BlaI family transcriptional regulator, penicillinase repressor